MIFIRNDLLELKICSLEWLPCGPLEGVLKIHYQILHAILSATRKSQRAITSGSLVSKSKGF